MKFTQLRQFNDRLRQTSGLYEREQIIRDLMYLCQDSGERVQAAMMLMGRLSLPQEGLTTGIKEAFVAKDLGLDGRQSLEALGEIAMKRCETTEDNYEVGDIWAIFRSYLEEAGRSHEDKSRIISLVLFDLAETKEDVPFLLQILCEKVNSGVDDKLILYALAGRVRPGTVTEEGPIPASEREKLSRAFAANPSIGEWIWALDHPDEPSSRKLMAGRVVAGTPLDPQLCERVNDVAKVLVEHRGVTIAQPKLDGKRVQIHVWKERGKVQVRIFSRTLHDATENYPELVETAKALPVEQHAILDGELVALTVDGAVAPFSMLQRRLGRVKNKEAFRIGVVLYDLLLWGDLPLEAAPYDQRLAFLDEKVGSTGRFRIIESKRIDSTDVLRDEMFQAAENGEEGLVCKAPWSLPDPGARTKDWIKLKPDYMEQEGLQDTYDFLVIGYRKGRGRRHGKIGSLWVAIRDANAPACPDMECIHSEDGQGPCLSFLPVCRVGTGLKDADLAALQELLVPVDSLTPNVNDGGVVPDVDVWVLPQVVIEMGATGGMTRIDKWAGFSLRFPYFIRVRDDKAPKDVTSTAEVKVP